MATVIHSSNKTRPMPPIWTSASVPGRVCLAGENLDWMVGPVLTASLQDLRVTLQAAYVRSHHQVHVVFDDGRSEIIVLEDPHQALSLSAKFVQQAVLALRKLTRRRHRKGLEIRVTTNLPTSGGLSSSAAYTISLVVALAKLEGAALQPDEIAHLA